jgi:hypothetical protein
VPKICLRVELSETPPADAGPPLSAGFIRPLLVSRFRAVRCRSSLPAAAGDEDTGKEKRSIRKNRKLATSSATASGRQVCRIEGLLNQIGRARSTPGLCIQLRAVRGFYSRYSTAFSVDAFFENSLEGGYEQGPCGTLCPTLTGLPHRAVTTGYNKSFTGMCAVVGCRHGTPGDQLHSATTAARKCGAPGCTNSMTHHLCGLCFASNVAGDPPACCF